MRLLLDVNVWVALFDDAHVFSEQANALIETRGVRIATCPLMENGVIRVMNSPTYGRRGAVGLRVVRQRLKDACSTLAVEHGGSSATFDRGIPLSAARGATGRNLRVL